MEHLFSISAYDFDTDEYGGAREAVRRITEAGADGVELLTGYSEPDHVFKGAAKGVHLPYATDWYSPWVGETRYIDTVSDENVRYRSFGRTREEMAGTLRDAIAFASHLSPAYGVFHASNTRMDEVMGFRYRDSDSDIVHAVAELLNLAVKDLPNGEPPFRIVLENLWWPGLSMTDDSGLRILEKELAFDNWGLCLDTGHLMNRLGNCRHERKSIEEVLKIIRRYPDDMRERIDVIHLHMSLSADYRERCITDPIGSTVTDDDDMITKAYEHICKVDQHRPFTDRSCTEIVRMLHPRYITHEISGPSPSERLSGFAGQRSLFGRI
ncbi:MAG: sugar phosphate isomerase/epimerase [Methanomassiliicoccaceae archaeon]|jgi:sugar phosphate isomerase/epimerase|nr:sugar phosphate isomerase/epimerase [Methanomassiliicoccaceae archaeon]